MDRVRGASPDEPVLTQPLGSLLPEFGVLRFETNRETDLRVRYFMVS
jgi:hypothetical protein